MSASARVWAPMTIETFDEWLERQRGEDARWELVGGEIVAMSNPSVDHEQIVANIGAAVKVAADRLGCRTYIGGMRVQRSDDANETDKPRPDVVVRCGSTGPRYYVTDPVVVVEVLSPSTMDVDRGAKLDFYKSLPTLLHIALVYQDQMRVELYGRTADGWEAEPLTTPAAQLGFPSVQFMMSLEQVYFGVEMAR